MVLGQTGVGKSSLINYIFHLEGVDRLATGSGAPVTKEGEFAEREVDRENLHIKIYDSWGLEDCQTVKWKNVILDKIDSLKDNFETRIHAIIYCISHSKRRHQDFDIDFIKNIIKENHHVIIALTQCDVADENQKDDFKRILAEKLSEYSDLYDVVETCSDDEPKIGQTTCTEKYGDKEILQAISEEYLTYYVIEKMKCWKEFVIKAIDLHQRKYSSPIGGVICSVGDEANGDSSIEYIKKSFDQAINDINRNLVSFQNGVGLCCTSLNWRPFSLPQEEDGFLGNLFLKYISMFFLATTPLIGDLFVFVLGSGKTKERVKQQCVLTWANKIYYETITHYFGLLRTKRGQALALQQENSYFENLVLYAIISNMGNKVDYLLYIKGVSEESSYNVGKKEKFANFYGVKSDSILALYDIGIFGYDGFVLTADSYCFGDKNEKVNEKYTSNRLNWNCVQLRDYWRYSQFNEPLCKTLKSIADEMKNYFERKCKMN